MNTFRCSGITSGGGDMNRSQLVDRIAEPVRSSMSTRCRHTTSTSSTVEIAASMGEKFTAGAGFKSAVS
jgi:hypothetical protein